LNNSNSKILKDNLKKALKRLEINSKLINKIIFNEDNDLFKELLLKINSKNIKSHNDLMHYLEQHKQKTHQSNSINQIDIDNNKIIQVQKQDDKTISVTATDSKKEKNRIRKRKQLTKDKFKNIEQISFRTNGAFKSLINKKAQEMNLQQSELIRLAIAKFLNVEISNFEL
jgi:hypothetical protein